MAAGDGEWGFIPDQSKTVRVEVISCGSAAFCLGTVGSTGMVSSFDGKTWSEAAGFFNADSNGKYLFSCGGPDFCVLASNTLRVTRDRTRTYTEEGRMPARDIDTLQCFPTEECSASGLSGIYWLSDGSWTRVADFPNELTFEQGGRRYVGGSIVQCSSPTSCVGLDRNDHSTVFVYDGSGWTESMHTQRFLSSLSCPRADFCMAAGPTVYYVWDGSTWRRGPEGLPFNDPNDVACAADGTCVAIETIDTTFWVTYGPKKG